MERIDLSYVDFSGLQRFDLTDVIFHNESTFYNSPFNENEIIKAYSLIYNTSTAETKLKSIINYLTFINENNITNLLKPTKLLFVENKFKGIFLPKIDGKNASFYLSSNNIPTSTKIEILKQIGNILLDIKNTPDKYNAAYADVHSDSFMVKNNDNNIQTIGIDAEGMNLLDTLGINNFYLYDNDNLNNINKYEANYFGLIKTTSQTDLYCYIMMIIEVIANNSNIYQLNIDDYNKYLDYLAKLGYNNDLLTSFASIYENKETINPLPYLNTIKDINANASYKAFRRS